MSHRLLSCQSTNSPPPPSSLSPRYLLLRRLLSKRGIEGSTNIFGSPLPEVVCEEGIAWRRMDHSKLARFDHKSFTTGPLIDSGLFNLAHCISLLGNTANRVQNALWMPRFTPAVWANYFHFFLPLFSFTLKPIVCCIRLSHWRVEGGSVGCLTHSSVSQKYMFRLWWFLVAAFKRLKYKW